MLPDHIKSLLLADDKNISQLKGSFKIPAYNPLQHYKHLTNSKYYHTLVVLRHYIKVVSDYYFGSKQKAKNIDLFMITPSVSSPTGPGSDSEPIKLNLGRLEAYLTDSSQFGFEPLLMNNFKKVYCYLPSMRGENPDDRHLNQFFHCEMEMIGALEKLIPIIEGYVKILCQTVLLMKNTLNKISDYPVISKTALKEVINSKKFPEITFDKAVEMLIKNKKEKYLNLTSSGRDITPKGEVELMNILKIKTPIWIKYFDRNRVAFYQKPTGPKKDKTINADLVFPALKENAFGGEIVGAGQRQNNSTEIYTSLKSQNNISSKPYEWYINLRRLPEYRTTSGFGLGIERFIAWVLVKKNIRDVILYPRLKNIKACP